MATTRVVTGPVVVLPEKSTGLTRYYYQGAVLPDGLDEERVQSAIDDGLVSEDVKPEELTAEDLSVAAAGDRLREAGRVSDDAVAVDEDGPPPKAAPKEAWVDFAVASGADRDEADGLTKAELIAAYGA